MTYQIKEGTGSLFKNEFKVEGDKKPNYKGRAMINGVEVEIAAWLETSAKGVKYMSLSFKEPFNKNEAPRRDAPRQAAPVNQQTNFGAGQFNPTQTADDDREVPF